MKIGDRLFRLGPDHAIGLAVGIVAAPRRDGIEAPCDFDGPINSARFLAYAEQCLAPAQRPGDIVSLDNPGSHKSKAARDAVRAAGAKRIFLPAYSSDLNPIDPSASSATN